MGNGNFKAGKSLPATGFNCAIILSFDFDGDGDLDLFSGSRSIPSIYGVPPKSFLFENDGRGSFTDVTATYAPAFEKLGLITDAKFKDVTGDGKGELIIVGEWMAPKILRSETSVLSHFRILRWMDIVAGTMPSKQKTLMTMAIWTWCSETGEKILFHSVRRRTCKTLGKRL